MKFLTVIAASILVSGLFFVAGAQEESGGEGMPGMIFKHKISEMHGGPGMLGMLMGRRGMEGLGKYRGPEFYLRMRAELGLDDSQVQKIKAIRMELVKQVSQAGAKLAVGRAELLDLLDGDNVDLAKVQAKQAEISGLLGDRRFAVVKAHVEATRVMTDEQRKKAQEMPRMGRSGGKMRQGGGRGIWGGGRMGPGAGLLQDEETEIEEK